ncbi:MAG: peptidase M16, partial [Deltaproteobacteria bacterium]
NPHRVLFTLEPDSQLEETLAKETRSELKALLATLTPDDLAKIKQENAALELLQESEEDLSSLPTLELFDVPPDIEIIKPDKIKEITLSTCYDKATSGILYFTCPVGAGNIPIDLFPLVPFFAQAFTNSGTKKSSYSKIAETMDLYTGGVTLSPFSGSYFSKGADAHSFLALQGKSLDRNIDRLFDMMDEFVKEFGFQDQDRLKSLLLQYQSGMESSIVSAGHRYAISLSARHLSKASHINELWHGIDQFQFIKKFTTQLADPGTSKTALDTLSSNLTAIADSLFKRDNLKPAVIGSSQALHQADQRISQLHAQLNSQGNKDPEKSPGNTFYTPDINLNTQRPYDGWYTNTAVSFVGQSFKTVRITHKDSPGLAVISKILRSLYLHREIREKGGAYGGFAMYNTEEGIFSFGSYRDPHIKRTLDVYKKACDYITRGEFTQTDVKEAILQVCSDIDKPETPGPAAMKAFYRDITHLSNEIRQHFKDTLLKLDKKRIQEIAKTYFTIEEDQKGISVISSKVLLEEANKALEADNRPSLRLIKI